MNRDAGERSEMDTGTAGLETEGDFCLGRCVGSEKGKKTQPNFIVD